ncbi:MAG: protealysin inhibitor emfourin [Methylomicrobium sp.]
MHVTLQRTGGFAGIPVTQSIDAASLSAAETNHLEQMIESAHFFELPALIPSKPQPDRFEYQITVERNGKKHSVTVAEHALPAELKPLVDWMTGWRQPAK